MAGRHNNPRITVDILSNKATSAMEEDTDSQDEEPVLLSQAPLKRKLLDEFDLNRPSIDPPPDQHMKVYLRIRPFSAEEVNRNEKQDCLAVETEHIVSTHPPKDSHTYRNATRGLGKTMTKFTFSHIFNENTSQKDFFNETMLGLVKDFIDGQNCLVFSYGVTSSGKTYTIQGNPKDAGILPRALDVLFNSISGQQWEPMNLKPKMFMGVQRLTADEEMKERKIKERVLKLSLEDDMDVMSLLGDDASDVSVATNTTTCSEGSNVSSMDFKESRESTELFAELDNRIREEAKVNVQDQGNIKFSVWASFAEIYNEQIYDLLEPLPKKKNSRRPCLKLSEDRNGSPYIKGLKEVNVNSADEAYKLLTIGQRNLSTACTKLNHSSSRSHCIFNIKILRVVDKDDPHVARVSMLSLCDLAGSERYTKSQTTGDRLKEAGNINTSLLTLGRCIETLKFNQLHKDHSRIVPFRESKLTRLFQNFFVGRGKAAMIVNVNQCASMFDETLHVFKFSAIASQVVVVQKPVFIKPKLPVLASPNPIPRTSIMWATPARTSNLANQIEAANVPLPECDDEDLEQKIYTQENIDELIGIIDSLQKELSMEKYQALKMEARVRAEVVQEMKKQFIDIEQDYSDEVMNREQLAEELAEKRIQILVDSKLSRKDKPVTDEEDEWVSSVLLHQEKVKVEKQEKKINELTEKITCLEKKLQTLTEGGEKVEKEKNNLVKQLKDSQKINDELQKELSTKNTSYMENLQKQLSEYEDKIKQMEQLMDANKEKEETNQTALIENLTQQLTQTRDKIRDQENEISELNDMLTEAGETFEQRESELQKLKDLVQEYEKKLETQGEAINVLEQAAADGKVAMETADQSLSKREECVSGLQAEIRELQGEVHKYRNKARFFEEALVEREQEALQWKHKYENDKEEHAKSQEALIHGFTAEISSLKSQIFHFKTQLYKSPTKSPGTTLKSPDVKSESMFSPDMKLKLFSTPKSVSLQEDLSHNVQEELLGLQSAMDKNVAGISELEHALHISRTKADDLEKKLSAVEEKCQCSESNREELEKRIQILQKKEKSEKEDGSDLENARQKILELENDIKSYVEKVERHESKISSLNEELTLKCKKVSDLESKACCLEQNTNDVKKSLHRKEEEVERLEQKREELEVVNSELKDMVNKTTNDLRTKEIELQILSPKSSQKLQAIGNSEKKLNEMGEMEILRGELKSKCKEIDRLNEKISKLKAGFKAEEILLNEANNKYSELEFRIDEKEIENQDLKRKKKEYRHKIEDLHFDIREKGGEITKAGEELAIAKREVEKFKRVISEKEAVLDLKEEEISQLTQKCQRLENLDSLPCPPQNAYQEEITALKHALKEKEKEIQVFQTEVQDYKARNSSVDESLAKMDMMSEELLKLEGLIRGKEEKISELSVEIDRLNSCLQEYQRVEDKIQQLEAMLSEKEEEIAMMTDNLSAILDEKEIEEKYAEEAVKLRNKVCQLETLLKDKEKQKDHDGFQSEVKDSLGITEHQQSLSESQCDMVNGLKNKVKTLEDKMRDRDSLESNVRDLESAVADKEVELCNKDKEIDCKTAEIECLRTKIENLEKGLNAKNCESTLVENLRQPLHSSIKELEVELEQSRHQLNESVSKMEELKVALKTCKEKVEHTEKENVALKNQLDNKMAVIVSNEKEIHILEGKVKCVLEKNNSLEETLEEKSKELKEQKSSYNEMVKKHEAELSNTKQLLDINLQREEELNAKLKTFEENKTTFETETESLKTQLNEKLANEKDIHTLGNQVKLLQEKNSQLEQKLEETSKEFKELNLNYAETKTQNELNNSEVSKLEIEIAELKSVIHTHKTLHHKAKGELEEALLELENKRSEMSSLSKDNADNKNLENQLDTKDRELRKVHSCIVDLQTEVSKLKDENAKIKKEMHCDVERAKESLKQLKDEIEILQSNIDKSENREKELESMLQDIQSAVTSKVEEILEVKKDAQNHLIDKESKIPKGTEMLESDLSKQSMVIQFIEEIRNLKQDRQKKVEFETELESVLEREAKLLASKDELESVIEREAKVLASKEDEIRKLTLVNADLEGRNCEMKKSLDDIKLGGISEKRELEEKCQTLQEDSLRLKDSLKNEEIQCQTLREELIKLEKLYESRNNVEKCDSDNLKEKVLEIQALYDAEKLKNEEYKKILNEINEQNILSPQSGIRRLRKEKIDTENALIEARFTINSLEKKLNDVELKQVSQGNQQNSNAFESVLQQKLNKATSKLHEVECSNRGLIKEVTQLQGTVEKLEESLREEKQKYEVIMDSEVVQKSVTSVIQADPRQSISSPSTKTELCKSREREQALHEQLNKTKVTIQEWSIKFTNIENELQQRSDELHQAKDTIATLEKRKVEGSKLNSEELEKYQERISDLEKDIINKEEQLDSNTILIADLKQQIETGLTNMKNFSQDVKSKDETIAVLKETLGEQENMLQLQEEYINSKESEISSNKIEYQSLLDKYQNLLESKNDRQHEHLEEARLAARAEAERDLLKKQLEEAEHRLQRAVDDRDRTNQLMKEVEHKLERETEERSRMSKSLTEAEHKLHRAAEERDKANKILAENNRELKDMEKLLTEARKECEDLKAQGSDKHAETKLEDLKHDLEKKIKDLDHKNKELHTELKDVKAKFHMTKETLKVAVEERHSQEKSLKEFREERDKLVSGLEAILKNKDAEIKQHKALIKQLKEREADLTKMWRDERDKIGAGLQELEKNVCKVKTEPVDTDDNKGDNQAYKSPVRKGSYREAMTPLSPDNNVAPSNNSRGRPPRPEPPQVEEDNQQTFKSPVRRTSSRSRSQAETPVSASSSSTSTNQRGSSRRGKKRSSPVHRDDDLPPLPKRVSTDSSRVSESEDYSTHLQVDATPTAAAKTLKRTRRKNGSQIDLSMQAEESTGTTTTRPQRNSKRSARSRILESFRDSPLARGSKRILDNIAEAFSPKSPTKEDNSNSARIESKENLATPSNPEVPEKKPSGRGRGRHKLYKEDTYISEPMDFTGGFVRSPDDVHKTVTRSLRSRKH